LLIRRDSLARDQHAPRENSRPDDAAHA